MEAGRRAQRAESASHCAAVSSELPLGGMSQNLARPMLGTGPMIRRQADRPNFFAPSLQHAFSCASRSALVAAYTSVSEAPWVESCSVDLPNLRLILRLSIAATRPFKPTVEWLQKIERIARGRSTKR